MLDIGTLSLIFLFFGIYIFMNKSEVFHWSSKVSWDHPWFYMWEITALFDLLEDILE